MNYTAETYSNINPVVFYGGGFCGGVDPRREQYAGEDVAGVEVPDYKTKYEALQNVIKDNSQLFEVDYYGVDNDNYVDGAGFCCEPKAQTKNARSLPTENVDYEKLQYYYHRDHLGSASYITNLDGEVVQHVEYVPFGEVFLEERNNTWNTPYLFNGKELDEETGLYYYGARYYNPRISLWYGVDPLAEKYPSIAPYAYVANNPIRNIDPDGRVIVDATGKQITYSAKTGWSSNATADAMRMGNAMMKTRTGTAQWNKMENSSTKIQLEISSATKVNGRKYTLGKMIPGKATFDANGKVQLLDAKVVVYEGTINKFMNDSKNSKIDIAVSYQMNTMNNDERIAAVAGHEAEHTTKENVQQNYENKTQGTTHDLEKKPVEQEMKILDEIGISNMKPLETIKLEKVE